MSAFRTACSSICRMVAAITCSMHAEGLGKGSVCTSAGGRQLLRGVLDTLIIPASHCTSCFQPKIFIPSTL